MDGKTETLLIDIGAKLKGIASLLYNVDEQSLDTGSLEGVGYILRDLSYEIDEHLKGE